jgi:ATP-dependent exoDNAse (exonuclease V) alpha subunit
MEKMGVESKAAAQIAAHATRDRKQMAGPEATLAAHQRLAADFGNQPQQVIAAAHERTQKPEHAEKKSPAQLALEAVTFARDRLYEREAVVDERHLFRDALRRGMGEVSYPDMRHAFESRLSQGEFQTARQSLHASARQITTERMVAMEREIVQTMRAGQGQAPPVLSHFAASQVAERQPHLNRAQQTSIEQVLTSPDRVQAIQGYAGVGKSTALSAIREGAESAGYAVEGFAPTSRAAQQLRDAGISATTLQGFLARGGQDQAAGDPSAKHLYMLDESSLASTKQVREFLHKIGPQDMVLLVGDIRQHQAVEAGKPFEQLQHAGMRTAQLDQIVRQRKVTELLKVVEHLAKADVVTGIRMLQEQGRVTEIPDRAERIAAIAKNYAANPEKTLIVSPDNASRLDINQAVHVELQQRGHVARENHPARVLVQRSEMTGADRAWASRYQVGDVLRYQRGSVEIGMQAGSYASVIAISQKDNLLTVQKQNGEQVTYDPSRLRGISAYREIEREFAIGERIQFAAPNRELHVANRALGTIEYIAQDGQMTVKMDTGKTVSFDPQMQRHFDHGYAVTSHSSQGLTADRVLINVDGSAHPEMLNNRFAYVAVSRGALDAEIFTDRAGDLEKRLGKDISKTAALDFSQVLRRESGQSMQQEPKMPEASQALGIGM